MIRIEEIQEKLLHLIGWEQNYDTANLRVAEPLTESESGLYFQQVHPLLTLQNLACIAPDFQNIEHEEYSVDKSYLKGEIVAYNGRFYKAVQDNKGISPVAGTKEVCDAVYTLIKSGFGANAVYIRGNFIENTNCRTVSETCSVTYKIEQDKVQMIETERAVISNCNGVSDYWKETDLFSDWLEAKTKASIHKAVMRFISEKLASGSGTALCENRALFDGTGRIADTVKNRGNFVGFEIVPVRSMGVTTKINRIGLQFTEPGRYTLYLFHSSSAEPIRTIELEKKRANSMEWFSVPDLYLPYISEGTDAGGSWYLGYMQDGLPEGSEAIRKERDWSKGPCRSCSRQEFLAWEAWSRYLEVHPFRVDGAELGEGPSLWDIEHNIYTYDTNYGLNLEVSVGCDFTDFIIGQRSLFTDVIAKQVAVDMLREFAFNANARTNRHSINASRVDILYEVDGDSSSMKKSGLSYQLEQALKAVKVDTSGIDRICLPCRNNGVKYRTV